MQELRFFRVKEVARIIGKPKSHVYRLIRTGRLKFIPFGRAKKIPRAEVERLVSQMTPSQVAEIISRTSDELESAVKEMIAQKKKATQE